MFDSIKDLADDTIATTSGLSLSPNDSTISLSPTASHSATCIEEVSIVTNITESDDVETCSKCNLVIPSGSPCSSLFPLEEYIETRAHANFLEHDQLDFVLMGFIECNVLIKDGIIDGCHHNPAKKRKQVTMKYRHHGLDVCKKTFLFLHSIEKDRLTYVKQHYLKNGLQERVHKNTKWAPKHAAPYSTKQHVVKFFAEENALLLPGRIPGYKRDDIKLLPSSRSKKVNVNIHE